jgi:hypothetical protein
MGLAMLNLSLVISIIGFVSEFQTPDSELGIDTILLARSPHDRIVEIQCAADLTQELSRVARFVICSSQRLPTQSCHCSRSNDRSILICVRSVQLF